MFFCPENCRIIYAGMSQDNGAVAFGDLSIHLCFICVLHLANENGLAISGVPTLDCMLVSNVPAVVTA